MRYPDARVLVFAKAPEAGSVKTRLIPALGAQAAAELHCSLILHQLYQASKTKLCPIELWVAPETDHPFFRQCSDQFELTLHRQEGSDLGARMAYAMTTALRSAGQVLLVGSDCPDLTAERLNEALGALNDAADTLFIPADDGGYVAIGMTQAAPGIFADIPWGSDQVMARTRDRMRAMGLHWRELAPSWDVDRPEDLICLMQRAPELDWPGEKWLKP